MSFFEPLPPEPEPAIPQYKWGPPLWDRPSEAVLGAPVAISALLAKTERFALVVENFVAYPNGFAFDLVIRGNPMEMRDQQGMGLWHHRERGPRLGFEFSDGTRVSSIGRPVMGTMLVGHAGTDASGVPTEPVLRHTGGHGNNARFETRMWCFPLPSPGPITVYAEWEKEGIGETSAVLDGDAIRDASTRAITLWEFSE